MIYKVGLLGATGRMGQEIAALLSEGFYLGEDVFELADAVSATGKLSSVEGIPVRGLGESPREPVHFWIDFSRPEATLELLKEIDTPLLVGTTGFSLDQEAYLLEYGKKHPVMLCPNTSPGMTRMVQMILNNAPPVDWGYTCVVEETHHRHKKDSPSGTAKALIAALAEVGYEEPQVLVARAGGVVGEHSVRFVSDNEEITIEHRVFNRKVFARGALMGGAFLVKQDQAKIYRMAEIGEKKCP